MTQYAFASTYGNEKTFDRFATCSAILHQIVEMRASVTTAIGFIVATIISLEALLVSPGSLELFAWHPFLMSMGAVGLTTAGIEAVRLRWTVEGVQSKIIRVQVYLGIISVS